MPRSRRASVVHPIPHAPRRWPVSKDAVRDIYRCAGLREGGVEDLAFFLMRMGRADLAQRMVEVEEFLRPDELGVSRAHLRAELGKREEGLDALYGIATDESRSSDARKHAWACINELDRKRRRRRRGGGKP